jgi:hypothetical protein
MRAQDGAGPAAAAVADGAAPPARERPERPAGKAGGVYIPPFKLAQLLREADDKASAQYQRLRWDALRKSLNGLINKVNVANLKDVLPEIFGEVRRLLPARLPAMFPGAGRYVAEALHAGMKDAIGCQARSMQSGPLATTCFVACLRRPAACSHAIDIARRVPSVEHPSSSHLTLELAD